MFARSKNLPRTKSRVRRSGQPLSAGLGSSSPDFPERFTFSVPPVVVPAEPQLVEALEIRLAPSGLSGVDWKPVTFDTPILLNAGQGLATSTQGGAYLMHVQSGQALVFVTDLNNNGQFDPNEITGIAAGNGLRLTSFVDINGDIVTNLNPNGTLTDRNPVKAGNDGEVLLNSRIDSIVLRTLTAADTPDFQNRLAPTTFSIYGNILAGGGLGTSASDGLIIDTSGWTTITNKFSGSTGSDFVGGKLYPTVG